MSAHLITTEASPATCPRCGATVLRGIAEGMTVVVDAEFITPAAEAAALLTGAWTFTLTGIRELIHRDAGRIRGGHLRGTIHVQHSCRRTS